MKRIRKLLAADPDAVLAKLETLRKSLFTFDNTRVLVITDVNKLPNPTEPWTQLSDSLGAPAPLQDIEKQHQRLSAEGRSPGTLGTIVVPMPTIDSSFALGSTAGPTSYTDPRLPALLVAVAYLDAVEGPLWRAVRGTGLAYGTGFSRDIDGGFMQFRVYRSPDAHRAFARSREVVEAFASGKEALERSALEGAVSAIVVSLADEQATMGMAAQMSFVNGVVRGVGPGYNEELLRKVRAVSEAEVRNAMGAVLVSCFEPGKANVVVTCAPVLTEVSFLVYFSVGTNRWTNVCRLSSRALRRMDLRRRSVLWAVSRTTMGLKGMRTRAKRMTRMMKMTMMVTKVRVSMRVVAMRVINRAMITA